jgi:hypothetical protein
MDTFGVTLTKLKDFVMLPRPESVGKLLFRTQRGFGSNWCEEGDLNPHAISGTSPSN